MKKNLFKDNQVVAVVCNQWGDTGKGKIIDLLAKDADVIIRGTGGANAGHTIIIGDKKHVFHLLPSSVLHPNKTHVIGKGVAFDPKIVIDELKILNDNGIQPNLLISYEAPLVLPFHLLFDRYKDQQEKIGTTGMGIGSLYSDYVSRIGLYVNDLLNPKVFKKKLTSYFESKRFLLKNMNKKIAKKILYHEHLNNGMYYNSDTIIDFNALLETYINYGKLLKNKITNTTEYVRKAKKKGLKILLEGSQGALLSIDYGTTKYQTSSDCTIEGLTKGCGLNETTVDHICGVAKAFYMTRVGAGPFPTEFGGKKSELYCNKGYTKEDEQKKYYNNKLLSSVDEFELGINIRILGNEYGATTGRTRRTGWLDLVALKYAMQINGSKLALTKVDVLSSIDKIKLCVAYKYVGEEINYAGKILKKGTILTSFPRFSEVLYNCEPVYETLAGWQEEITKIRNYENLPLKLKNLINYVENYTNGQVEIISVGPRREEVIFK